MKGNRIFLRNFSFLVIALAWVSWIFGLVSHMHTMDMTIICLFVGMMGVLTSGTLKEYEERIRSLKHGN